MTIRKITGRTSSLAVKATVTQGGIFKAALQNPSSIKAAALERLQKFPIENWDLSSADVDYDLDSSIILPWGSELDSSVTQEVNAFIPKIANVTARVIDHLLYDPDGFGIRHFYEILLLGEAVGRSIGKTNTDSFSLADSLLLNYSLGRNPADVQNTDDLIGFLLKTSRTFDDSAAAVSRPYLWFAPNAISDIQNFADSFFIARVKNFEDTLTGSDAFTRLAQSFRTFEDNVGMLDAFTFIDGSTFELRRRLSDTVSVNTTNLEVLRNTGNETENFSFFIDKVLDPDMELLSHVAKLGLKTITSIDITSADRPFLYTTKPATDSADPVDTAPIFLGIKRLSDTETLDSLINFSVSKLLADTTIMLDNLAFGDQLAYDSTKLVADEIGSADRPFLYYAPRTIEDSLTATDTNRSRFIKASSDLIDLTESNTKLFAKNTSNILSLADILNIVRLKDYADVFTPADLSSFALTKIFADTVEADDPLVRLTDGKISLLIKQRQDTEPIDDYFARAVKFYRYPHHNDGGLGNFVPALEKDSKFVSLRARAGALTTYPIIRTNLISWSEQFDTNQSGGYWTSIGATVVTNAALAPQNVISSNSTTYDADQLQELFYNNPNNTNYGRSWYQIVPGRWVMSSDGDLLKQDTSNGIHQLSSPNIPELIGTTNFGFSIHLKYAGHRYVRLWVTSFVNVDVDMVNNVVVATSAGKASMQPVGGGWFLVQLENRIVNFGIAPEMQILNEIFYNSTNSPYGLTQYKLVPDNIISSARIVLLDSSLNTTFTGNGTDGVYVWGAQLEVGDQPEQEVSSLRYIRTAGGSATRIGFSVTPTDNDRVFVGRIQRRGGQEVRNDPFEIISLLLQYKVSAGDNLATPVDYAARSVRYFRSGVIEPGLRDVSSIGLPGQRRYSGDSQENVAFYINKYAKSGTTSTTAYVTNRANHLRFSERFDYPYWTKTNVTASSGISVMSRALPYRNVLLDANQIQEIVYNGKYNYQGKSWYNLAPLTTRTSFTSNAIVDIFESSANDIHAVQAFGFSTNLSGDYFASSVYASPNNGVSKFRMQVGTVWADFDLSSISVITSTGTLYNNIRAVDTSTGWYLCQIIGPTVALGTLNFLETLPASDRIFLLQPLNVRPDSFTAADLRYNYFIKGLADTTTMLSNFYIADGSTYTGNKQLLDSFVAGSLEGYRTSGNEVENVKFLTKFTAHRSGEFTSLTIKLINDVRGSAAKVAEDVFVNKTNKTWFQLAPYYNSSVHLNDYPTDYDRVRIGTQSGGVRSSSDPFETINLLLSRFWLNRDSSTATDVKTRQFVNKQIDETKLIPTIPKFDAAAVTGLFYNTTRNIDGRRYTPQDGNYVYYKKTDWYSLAPRYARPRFAWGTGNTPGTIMIDNMALGDNLSYYENFNLRDSFLPGSTDGVRGTSDNENLSYFLDFHPRRGVFTDLYIAKVRPTRFNGNQALEIFYGTSNNTTAYTYNNPYKKSWFQLAPYYASYDHYKNTPGEYDFVRVGSVRGADRANGWPQEIMQIILSKTFADATTMLDRFDIGDQNVFFQDKSFFENLVLGLPNNTRVSGSQIENVSFVNKFVARRGNATTTSVLLNLGGITKLQADVTADVYANLKTSSPIINKWYQLAPYYKSRLYDNDSDYDRVRIGSQTTSKRSSSNPYETVSFLFNAGTRFETSTATDVKINFIDKHIDETKLIPTIPKFDAQHVHGLFYNTPSFIDGKKYTPQDGNYAYYKRNEWYNLVPRYGRPRFAWGTGNTPGTIMIDNMQLGDDLTYLSQFNLKTTVLIGSPDGVRGTSDIENFSYNLNMRPRRGAFTDLYIAKLRPTKFDADQTAGIFWGSSNSTTSYTKLNPYGKRWYQLAPYYASYEHIKDTPGQYDFVRVGSVRGGQRHLGWPTEIMSLGILKTPYETSVTTDVRGNFFNLTALRGDTNAGTGYWTTRTNYISSSGVFTGADWIKSNITLSSNSEQIFYDPVSSGYRSTLNDANQVVEMFYSPKNNTAGKRWYDIVPVRPQSLTPLILDKIPILTETTSVGQHYMETVVNKPVTADQYYLFRVIALTRSGTNNIRVYINNDYADFTLYGATAVSVSNPDMTSITATYGAYGGALGLLGRTTSTSVTVRIQLIDQSGNTSYAGTTANSVWVWGAQLEFGEYFNPTNQILIYNSFKNPGDYYRNSWIKSTNGPRSRPYEIFGTDTRTDGVTIGLDQDARIGGSSKENVSFKTLLRARRSGDATSILITLGSITRTSADQTAEVFDNIRTSTPIINKWYQLAPYYRSSLYDRPTDYDLVRVGSQTLSRRTSSDPYENVSFWLAPKPLTDSSTATDVKTRQFIRKEFSETRMIPNNPRFDAARVAGIDLVSSGAQRINLNSYTPVTGSTTYYKSWDWFSEAPLSNRAIYALGNAGVGPIMLDNMSFGDNLTYTGTKFLSSLALTVGTQLGGAKFSGDPAETTDVNLRKTAKQSVFTDLYIKNRSISPLDADQVLGLLYNSSNNTRSIIRNNPYRRRWYQLAPYYNSYGHIKNGAQDTDRVLVSYRELFQPWLIKGNNDIASTAGDGGTRKQTGQNSLETTRLDVQLFARRSALTTSNVVITTKTNWVSYSEDFTGFYWGKTNATTVQAPQLMSGRYPYRNTNYDAVQVANQFMLISTSSAFTRYNNYYNRAWYAPAPLTTRVAFSSTVLQYLTDQDATGPHYMQADVLLRDYSIPEEWVTFSLHVQRQTAGTNKFRMDVGRCYADFDLSSVSVITSTVTVGYANIRFVDTSAGVFLCQIIAPIQTFPNTLIRFAVSSDTVTAGDSGINFLRRDLRTFDDAVVSTESINNDKITDYHL